MKKILILLVYIVCTSAFAQKNLIKNGGFETELLNWRGDVATLNPYDKKAGNKSGMINQFTGQEWKGLDQIATIPKDTYAIEISAWVKADGIEGGKEAYNAGAVIVDFMTGSETTVGNENIAQVKGSTAWTFYKKIVTVPLKAQKIRLMLALAQTNGSVLFDEVKAVPLSQEEYQKLTAPKETEKPVARFTNGDFEKQLQGWTGNGQAETTVVKEGTTALALTSQQETWTAADQIADVPEGSKQVKISGWIKAENIIKGKDAWNNGVFIIEFTKDGTTKTTEDQTIGAVTGTTEWTFVEKIYAVPEASGKFRLMLALSNCKGKLLADDIQVTFIK
jgi:hypothetical protein